MGSGFREQIQEPGRGRDLSGGTGTSGSTGRSQEGFGGIGTGIPGDGKRGMGKRDGIVGMGKGDGIMGMGKGDGIMGMGRGEQGLESGGWEFGKQD